ncbi:MAG: sigma-70 family RNA polymerase sigma factor [Sedimentisphaerales bacterium]|nr:sigma-70 family RNA polymerase sigma factor [Sedimentisphaerales bacterium]
MARHRKHGRIGKEAVSAAAEVFAAHGTFIRAVIRFQAKSRFREDDLYQQFFLSLIRKPVPSDVQNVRSYLYRAIRNDVLDSLRRQTRQQEFLEKHAEEIRISINNRTPTDAIVLGDERASAFRYLTRQLRHREAEAIMLRFRDNCSVADIAARMGVDRRTVSRYLSAGLRRLRQILVIE